MGERLIVYPDKAFQKERGIFEVFKKRWKSAQISNETFLPYVITQFFTSRNLIGNSNTTFSVKSPKDLEDEINGNTDLEEIRNLGKCGENPGKDLFSKRFSFLRQWLLDKEYYELVNRTVSSSTRGVELRTPGLVTDDEKLNLSLPLHLYSINRDGRRYERHQEEEWFEKINEAIGEGVRNNEETEIVTTWLHYCGISSYIGRLQIQSLLHYIEDPSLQYCFEDISKVPNALTAFAFFQGWKERIDEKKADLENRLPSYLQNRWAKEIAKSASFAFGMVEKEKLSLLSKTFSYLKEGKTDMAKDVLAKECAKAIIKGRFTPLKYWEIENLGIEDRIEKFEQQLTSKKSETNKTNGWRDVDFDKYLEQLLEHPIKISDCPDTLELNATFKAAINYLVNAHAQGRNERILYGNRYMRKDFISGQIQCMNDADGYEVNRERKTQATDCGIANIKIDMMVMETENGKLELPKMVVNRFLADIYKTAVLMIVVRANGVNKQYLLMRTEETISQRDGGRWDLKSKSKRLCKNHRLAMYEGEMSGELVRSDGGGVEDT